MAEFDVYGNCVYGTGNYKGTMPAIDPPLASTEYFVKMPNWAYGVEMSYNMKTVIQRSRKLVEQRKPLQSGFIRQERFSVTLKDDGTEFEHFVESKHADDFYVPIFIEPLRPSGVGSMAGLVNFPITNNPQQFYNLRHLTEYIMLIDLNDVINPQVCMYTDYVWNGSAWSLRLGSAISGAFNFAITIVYPCMVAYLSSKRIVDRTDDLIEVQLTFKERY